MARLRDVPTVLRNVGPIGFAKRVYAQFAEDSILTWASALAYSWLFAIFPFLLFLLTLIPYLPQTVKSSATNQLELFVSQLPKGGTRQAIEQKLRPELARVLNDTRGGLLTLGLALALFSASGGMAATMAALDKCYDVKKPRSLIRQRAMAILLTIIVATLLLAVVALLPIGTIVKDFMVNHVDWLQYDTLVSGAKDVIIRAFDYTRWILALVFMFLALAITYYLGPSFRGKWQAITPGALFCVVMWIVLGLGLRYYIEHWGSYDKTYGAVGGVVILLFLFYVDAAVLLVGAEINSEIDFALLNLPKDVQEFPQSALDQEDTAKAQSAAAVEQGLAVPTPNADQNVKAAAGKAEDRPPT